MKKRGKRYYQKLFRVYPDLVTTVQFREMLGGIGDTFARKLIHEKWKCQEMCSRETPKI